MLRRASSFHSGEFIDNSQYFNSRIKELKKSNSQQSPMGDIAEHPGCSSSCSREPRREKTVSWKDADDYFKQESKMLTPLPQTGRASVAKLRTQNAGMVLAKAKLFDDPTKEAVDMSRRQSMKLQLATRITAKDDPRSPHGKSWSDCFDLCDGEVLLGWFFFYGSSTNSTAKSINLTISMRLPPL